MTEETLDTETDLARTTCACGCGEAVAPGKTWIRGHHGRGRPGDATPIDDDVTLVALTPAEMGPAQAELAAWCTRKIAALQAELVDLDTNLAIVAEAGVKCGAFVAAARRARQRVTYYEKIQAAVQAGYLIVPNMPVDVFAVRVKRSRQPEKVKDWVNFPATPELLPAGEGRYVDETTTHTVEEYEGKDWEGKPTTKQRYHSADYDAIDFPVTLVKPVVLGAVQRALGEKLFDQLGIVQNTAGQDPIVVGQLLDPRGNRRRCTFFLAWWLDTRSL